MKKITKLITLFIFIMSLSSVYASDITNQDIMSFIKTIDEAIVEKDADKLSSLISDDAILKMNMTMGGGTESLTSSKDEYILMLKEGWGMFENYKYSRSELKINIHGDSATVNAIINESMTMNAQGQTMLMSGKTNEKVIIKLINGAPLITDLVGDSIMEISPL
ncbi:MAG: nuclear transport factor 2 family protein [Gammaproteobacteria bacterium]|nr:nuclear transport factor 2 family protein [Gammaproteobacteria bacterium]